MKCPHCNVEVNTSFREISIGKDYVGSASLCQMLWPNVNCKMHIIKFARGTSYAENHMSGGSNLATIIDEKLSIHSSHLVPMPQ